jgi:colanic acid/amylovoran biosynthesis glycosyltransferase
MSCGVPIVGYDNEAFRGLRHGSGIGWLAPISRPEQIVAKIAELNADRSGLLDALSRAVESGRRHTFEWTLRARVEHMKSCARPTPARPLSREIRQHPTPEKV